MSDMRIPFNGGSFKLREAGEFTDKTGKNVKFGPAIVVQGVTSKNIAIPLDLADELEQLFKMGEYKAYRAKVKK